MSSIVFFFVFAVAVDSSRSGENFLNKRQLLNQKPIIEMQLEPGAARKSHLETAAGKTQA